MQGSYVMGIDLGLKGGIALLDAESNLTHYSVMPVSLDVSGKQKVDVKELNRRFMSLGLSKLNVALVCMERVHSFGNEARSSIFSFGKGTGRVESLLELLDFPCVQVLPQEWKNTVLKGTKKDKNAALGYVYSRFPGAEIKKHDGLADAICLALYGKILILSEVKKEHASVL